MAKAALSFLFLLGYIWFSEFFVDSQAFSAIDVYEAEVRLKSDLMKNYANDVMPPHNSSSPVVSRLGLSIISIKNLDARTQTLETEGWLKLGWNDTRLTWDPKNYADLTVIRFLPHKIWQPDIELYNSARTKETEVEEDVYVLVYSTGTVVWVPPATIYSLCDVNLKYYPYDKHNCTYKFGSWTHGGDHIDVQDYNMGEKNDMLSDLWNTGGEWEIVDSSIIKSTKVYDCCPEPYHDVTYSVILQRRSPFYKVAILCPLIATSFLILASFWVSPASYHRITLTAISFLTMIALLMHLSTKLAAVGSNCPVVMIFCGILLMMSALSTVISIIFIIIASSRNNRQTPEWIRRIVQSPIMKLCCIDIAAPMHSNAQESEVDYSLNLVAEDDSKPSGGSAISKPNLWITFFTLIDRMLFLICLIIITAVMITSM